MSLPLTVVFVLSSSFICTTLLNLDSVCVTSINCWIHSNSKYWINHYFSFRRQAIEHPIVLIRMSSCFVIILSCIAWLCYFGNRVTTQFEEINDAVYTCSWNRFPLEAQKLLPTMLIVCQKPVYIHGHMNLRCTHEFFRKVTTFHLFFLWITHHIAFDLFISFLYSIADNQWHLLFFHGTARFQSLTLRKLASLYKSI